MAVFGVSFVGVSGAGGCVYAKYAPRPAMPPAAAATRRDSRRDRDFFGVLDLRDTFFVFLVRRRRRRTLLLFLWYIDFIKTTWIFN